MIYFVSGHLDLSTNEFDKHYRAQIKDAVLRGSSFVVGDARGCDTMAQRLLVELKAAERVVVFHMCGSPRNCVSAHFGRKGGFATDGKRDAAMTECSDADIAWFRSVEEQKEKYGKKYRKRKSGTQKNVERRRQALTAKAAPSPRQTRPSPGPSAGAR